MPNTCLGNLLPSSVLAYDNIDLIPNGYIPVTGTGARPRTRNQGGTIISEKETIRLLPADRIYAEFWYGVSSRVTGTNLNDLGAGVFGSLAGGAASGIISALGCALIGDSEQVKSRWVFHVADAESKLNRQITLTEENIKTGIISLPEYVIAVLGVTKSPILFTTPTTPLTKEQIAKAKEIPESESESILGKRVAPSQLTDSDIRLLLGISSDLNELENLGNSQRGIKGWHQTQEGQIQAEFKNYKYSDRENLFVEIVRDSRKNYYRADNEYDRTDGHCFWNGSTDDITDKKIRFLLSNDDPNVTGPKEPKLKAGDKVYISYEACTKPLFRHAIENKTNFFLFPDQSVYQLPPLDYIKGWNFKKFKFKVRKKETERCVLSDIINDNKILDEIATISKDSTISTDNKTKKINALQNKILLEDIECQRIIESKLEKSQRKPFIKGCYFADSRGILSVDFRNSRESVVLIPRSSIRDKSWFDSLLKELQQNTIVFDQNGELILDKAEASFFDDFLFDISDHVNMSTYDNEKFGYERRFAGFISKCSTYVKDKEGTGVGFPNLDFIKNNTPGRNDYDLTSAKFDSVPMQGSGILFSCNTSFTYDFGFCTKGTITSNMLLRTPVFLDQLSLSSRIYVEKFQAQNPLKGDGAIWVGTKPSTSETYSVTTDPKNYYGCLVYPDSNNGTTNFRMFEDGKLYSEFQNLKLTDPQPEGHSLPVIDSTLTQDSIKNGGYDKILGDQPGYFKGTEITKEKALILMNKVSNSIVKKDKLFFTKNEETGRLSVSGISNRRLKKITIKYVPISKDFLEEERLLSCVFPGSKSVIDNIFISYNGKFSEDPKFIHIDTRYINLENWFIDGSILKKMDVKYIEVESIEDTEYQKYKISTGVVSTCFDSSGNWLVFYEDENSTDGDLSKNGRSADGSHLVGPFEEGELPGLQEKSDKEISCLLSPDYGVTWYDFKAIVRTEVGDTVGSPYCVADRLGNKVHLFYVLNDTLMHKIIDTQLFKYEDSFLGYKRPNSLNEKTAQYYGLYHFSPSGVNIREKQSNVVVGDFSGSYLVKQAKIVQAMRLLNRTDFRIVASGDGTNYEKGFPEVDFLSYKDQSGQLKVMFVANGRFYCRGSSDEGSSWFDFIKEGILIHKNSNLQELKSIKNLGIVLDLKLDISYITYQVDGMLFIRKFDSNLSMVSSLSIENALNPDSSSSKPVFVVGSIAPELKVALKNKESSVIFSYKDVDVFGSQFSISETPSLGYSTMSGLLRFFYKDAAGNFRAFSYPETPVLDINYGER